METFILALVYALPSFLQPVARPVAERLIRVWRWSEGLARHVRGAFRLAVTGATRLRDGIVRLGRETYDTFRWLLSVQVPRLIKQARDAVVKWAADQINRAKAVLTSAIDTLRRWATSAVNALRSLVDNVRRWAAGLLSRLDAAVKRIIDRVFGLWSTPARLAGWLVGAMWTALWRYVDSNLDRIVAAVYAKRRAVFFKSIETIERLVGRLL